MFKKMILLVFLSLGVFSLTNVYAEIVEGIAAIVNEEVITLSELEEAVAPVKFKVEEKFAGEEAKRELKKASKIILNQMIVDKLILAEAKRRKIKVAEELVNKNMEDILKKYKSAEEFEKDLKKEGITKADIKKQIKEQILRMKIINKEVKSEEEFSKWVESLKENAYIEIRIQHTEFGIKKGE